MTGNSKEIKKLKYQQAKKKQLITKYKKRVKKHLILLVLPFIAYIAYYIDNAYSTYGSVSKFLTIVALVLGVLILLYLIAVRFMIRQREQEIKVIRGKLYHLMKLNDE